MRESLVCIGQIGKNPYRFPETGTTVYSYEELCYYLGNHLICYLYTLPDESLCEFIRDELGLDRLYRQLIKFQDPARDQMKYFAAIFREGNYYSEDEIREILDRYRKLKNAPQYQKCKWLGDLFVRNDHAKMALEYYKEALKEDGLTEAEQGSIYHNMGVALVKLFRFSDAKIQFLNAYMNTGDERSLYYYYGIIAVTEGVSKADEEVKDFEGVELLLDGFHEQFAKLQADFQASGGVEKFRKMYYLSEHGREQECGVVWSRLIRSLQSAFRGQLEEGDRLLITNLPSNDVIS